MRLLLILTLTVSLYFLLTQSASAKRWRGLIASVAALESAKKQEPVPVTVPKEVVPKETVPKETVPEKSVTLEVNEIECTDSNCILTPKVVSVRKVTATTEDGATKSASPLTTVTKTMKTYMVRRFRLFKRRCVSCK